MAATPPAQKRVLVLLRRPPTHPRTAQGLRATVGYTPVGLRVTVGLCGPARALVAPHTTTPPMATARPLALLSALGHTVCTVDDPDTLTRLCDAADHVIAW